MRTIGVLLLLFAVAALLVSVSKAEGHRHDEQGCAHCVLELQAEDVGVSSEASARESAASLESGVIGLTENPMDTTADHIGRVELWLGSMRAARPNRGCGTSSNDDRLGRESGPAVLGVGV